MTIRPDEIQIKKEPGSEDFVNDFKPENTSENLDVSFQSAGARSFEDNFPKLREEATPRLRICFDPEQEIPLLQKWFILNNHPSRAQVVI